VATSAESSMPLPTVAIDASTDRHRNLMAMSAIPAVILVPGPAAMSIVRFIPVIAAVVVIPVPVKESDPMPMSFAPMMTQS